MVINLLVISGVVLVGIFNMDSENWIAGTGFFPGGMTGVGSLEIQNKFTAILYNYMIILIDYKSLYYIHLNNYS